MTTFHEHVPQTRRAVRESERATAEPQPEQFPFFSQTTPVQQPITRGRRARPAEPVAPDALIPDALPPTQAIPAGERPNYRPRDFSPEGRRAAVESWSAPAASSFEAQAPAVPPAPAAFAAPAPVPPAPAVAPAAFVPPSQSPAQPQQPWRLDDSAPVEHTLSRRELRALREAQEQTAPAEAPATAAPAVPAPVKSPPAAAAPVTPAPVASAEAAPAELVAPAVPVAEQPAASSGDAAFDALLAQMQQAAATPPAPAPSAAPVAPAVAEQVPVPPAPVAAVEAEEPVLPQREVEPPSASTYTLPANHWSRQLDLEQETQPYESTINRVVGSAAGATNALMLPEIPRGDIRGALTATGEVMLTGSIDLAPGFASTGSTRQMEHSGIDALFEQDDHEVVSTDSAPVRAVRAVSTVSSTSLGSLPTPTKQKGTRGLTILLVTACGLATIVTGLVVAAFAFNLF